MSSIQTRDAPASRTLERHGAALYRVAAMLTDDDDWAARLVVRSVRARGTEPHEDDVRSMCALVVLAWLGGSASPEASGRPSSTAGAAALLQDVRSLPDDQRALLALCAFGSHTYREAAAVLDIHAGDAALLLGRALHALASPEPLPSETPVMA